MLVIPHRLYTLGYRTKGYKQVVIIGYRLESYGQDTIEHERIIGFKHPFMPELAREADMKSGMTKVKLHMLMISKLVAKWST